MCPYLIVETLLPKECKIADLGCGIGLFSNILALTSEKRIVEGYDISETKIKTAKASICKRENISFTVQDIRDFVRPNYDVIVISDTLYLIPFEEQINIIKNCFNSLNKNGILLLKEVDKKPYWKYCYNYFQETIAVKILGFTYGYSFYFHDSGQYIKLLENAGFFVTSYRFDKGYPYPHVVYKCVKK